MKKLCFMECDLPDGTSVANTFQCCCSTADALRAVYDLDLPGLEIDPPRGFGRD